MQCRLPSQRERLGIESSNQSDYKPLEILQGL